MPRQAYKTRDITGGLPRIAELFEARRPKDPATMSEIDGIVKFGEIKRGKREIYVYPMNKDGTIVEGEAAQVYEVPAGKHLRVHEGDRVRAGDRLTEGPVNPHEILLIKGPRAVQEYLLNEVQEVYRLQGVRIADKHIGVIVRQMLQKVRVTDPGDTSFLEAESVDLVQENERVTGRRQAGDGRAGALNQVISRPSRSFRLRRSRRPPGCSPMRRSAGPRTTSGASRRTSSSGTSSRRVPATTGTSTWRSCRRQASSRRRRPSRAPRQSRSPRPWWRKWKRSRSRES
jgi:hypothetical protein